MMSKPRTLFRLVTRALAGGPLLALAATSATGLPEQYAQGIYNRKCASCHAKDGSGNTADGRKYHCKGVREAVKKYSEEEMVKIVKNGEGKHMDSFSDELSAEEIKAVIHYYRSLANAKK